MAQATEKSQAVWRAMPGSLDRLPAEQVKSFLLSRLREIDGELVHMEQAAPSAGWWLQRVGQPFFDLSAPDWDPFLYGEYLRTMRRAIVAALQTL